MTIMISELLYALGLFIHVMPGMLWFNQGSVMFNTRTKLWQELYYALCVLWRIVKLGSRLQKVLMANWCLSDGNNYRVTTTGVRHGLNFSGAFFILLLKPWWVAPSLSCTMSITPSMSTKCFYHLRPMSNVQCNAWYVISYKTILIKVYK